MRKITVYVFIALFVISCNSPQKENDAKKAPVRTVQVPDFNADSAYAFIAKQLSFGPRVPGSEAHSQCAGWLEEKMNNYTSTVEVQSFKARAYNGSVLKGKNIISSFNPENKKRILLCAHWDSRPFADHDPDPSRHNTPIDGANDGASGVGVLIEMARCFSRQLPEVGVDIIFFDLEDYGPPQDAQNYGGEDHWGLGSQFWSRNPHKANYRARYGILLDMVGVEDATFLQEGVSMLYAPSKVKKVWSIAARMGYDDYFVDKKGGFITDDHYYINKLINIPTINIIHLDNESVNGSFFEHWHTVNDNLENINRNTLNVVGRVVMEVVYYERG